MKLVIARHGQCKANVDGVVAGAGDDSPLTEVGRAEDAPLVAKAIAGYAIKRIIASPLVRASQTAEIIRDTDFPDLKVEMDPRFTEKHVGVATGLPLEEYFAREKAGEEFDGAESEQEMFDRVKAGLDDIASNEVTTLLVTHNGTYRMIECVVQGRPATDFAHVEGLHNGEIRVIEL